MNDILFSITMWVIFGLVFVVMLYLLATDDDDPVVIERDETPCPDDPEYRAWKRNTRDPHERDPLW